MNNISASKINNKAIKSLQNVIILLYILFFFFIRLVKLKDIMVNSFWGERYMLYRLMPNCLSF